MKKEKKSLVEKLGNIINLFGNAILMNLLFLAACLPIVTIGQAWCGLLGAIRYNVRGERWITGFSVGYKTRFFRGTIIWCIGLVLCYIFLGDMNAALEMGVMGSLVVSAVMFAFVAMIVQAALLLNVYIYTDVNNWLKNVMTLLFKGLIPLLICSALFWLPVILLLLVNAWIVYESVMILICAYFVLIALVETMSLKGALTAILLDCRARGIIVEEEGAAKESEAV